MKGSAGLYSNSVQMCCTKNEWAWPIGEAAGARSCCRRLENLRVWTVRAPLASTGGLALRNASDPAKDRAESSPYYIGGFALWKNDRLACGECEPQWKKAEKQVFILSHGRPRSASGRYVVRKVSFVGSGKAPIVANKRPQPREPAPFRLGRCRTISFFIVQSSKRRACSAGMNLRHHSRTLEML
jgi:hypothetical protein